MSNEIRPPFRVAGRCWRARHFQGDCARRLRRTITSTLALVKTIAEQGEASITMSRLFGNMRQVGIVVRDIEAAMRHWVEVCGVGPWFYTDRLLVTGFTYADQRYDDVHISIALANSGDVQLELIQQRCNTPTMYRDFLAAGHERMQHWSSWPQNYDA